MSTHRLARSRGHCILVCLGAPLATLVAVLPAFAEPQGLAESRTAAEVPGTPPDPLPLAWCLEHAAAGNPSLAASAASAEAARQRIVPAGALEDPRFGYQASNLPVEDFDLDSTPLSGQQLSLAQKLPFPGLRGARKDGARAAARAEEALLVDRHRRVAAATERAWAELGFSQRALEITEQNLELLRQLARIAEAKYAVGGGLQQDVLLAQVELTRRLKERLGREASIADAQASLAALLDLAPGASLPRTASLFDDAELPDREALLERLERTSPRLRALEARIDEAERLRRAAELAGLPDFDLGIGYRLRKDVRGDAVNGDDFVSAGVTIRLPIARSRWRAEIAEREALLRRARADHRAMRAALRRALRSRHADLERADATLRLLRDGLIPQSRQSFAASRSAYEVDKVEILTLIDTQVSLLEAELGLVRAAADRRTAFAALEAALGEPLR